MRNGVQLNNPSHSIKKFFELLQSSDRSGSPGEVVPSPCRSVPVCMVAVRAAIAVSMA